MLIISPYIWGAYREILKSQTYPCNISDYLKSEDDIRGFLQEVAETGDTSDFIRALGIAARVKGMTKIAQKAGVM